MTKRRTSPGSMPSPRASGASSLRSKKSWSPRQIPITGRPAVATSRTAVAEAGPLQVPRGLAEVAHPRHQHPVRAAHRVGIRRERGGVPAGGQRAHDALQIVDAVVHHRNHSVPLVDGTPTTRGSTAVAPSSARANALNAASTM